MLVELRNEGVGGDGELANGRRRVVGRAASAATTIRVVLSLLRRRATSPCSLSGLPLMLLLRGATQWGLMLLHAQVVGLRLLAWLLLLLMLSEKDDWCGVHRAGGWRGWNLGE